MHRMSITKLAGILAASGVIAIGGGAGVAVALASGGRTTAGPGATGTTVTTETQTYGTPPDDKTVQRAVTISPPGVEGVTTLATPPPTPSQIIPRGAPVAVSNALLTDIQNGWQMSTGAVITAAYAGVSPLDPSTGRFVVITEQLPAATQSTRVIDVPGAGALSLVNPPIGATSLAAGLQFSSANGIAGSLSLLTDTVFTR